MNTENYINQMLFYALGALIAFLLMLFIIWKIAKSIKKFIFELIDHINGAGTQTGASRKDYTAEARNACEKVTPKRKQDVTPPWEK